MPTSTQLATLKAAWLARWPEALALWSRFTQLQEPHWCLSAAEARAEGLTASFAMIRFHDQAVVIDLNQVAANKLDEFPLEILAHEIGHHVYCPADLTDNGRMLARIRRALPTKEQLAPFVANLYTDLLINDRLKRQAGLRLPEIYERLATAKGDPLWTFYMRTYEILWQRLKGSLAQGGSISDELDSDAYLASRVVRVYAKDWLKGAGRFAALCLPYLATNDGANTRRRLASILDTQHAGQGAGVPDGLVEIDSDEAADAQHPGSDSAITGLDDPAENEAATDANAKAPPQHPDPAKTPGRAGGQCREPFELGEILASMGLKLTPAELAIRYYQERARPYLVKFPVQKMPTGGEPLPEGQEDWDIGQPLQDLDWMASAVASPTVIPGITTRQRTYGESPGAEPFIDPVDLDLYVDCSGSMPNPQVNTSFPALAGAIMALSALRVGACVKATLWSGKRDFKTTGAFVRDTAAVLGILTGYIGGATQFPIHLLRETFAERGPADRAVHVLVISDDGVTTMFEKDEQGNSGWDVAATALAKGRSGGTLVLNLGREIQTFPELVQARRQGWGVFRVSAWDDLVSFARDWSRANYGLPPPPRQP